MKEETQETSEPVEMITLTLPRHYMEEVLVAISHEIRNASGVRNNYWINYTMRLSFAQVKLRSLLGKK